MSLFKVHGVATLVVAVMFASVSVVSTGVAAAADDSILGAAALGAGAAQTSVDGGGSHSCAVLSDGSVKCWGSNAYGEIGDGTSGTDRLSPVAVALGTNLTAVSIGAGLAHSCALLNDGSVKCWGSNFFGQVGDGTTGTNRLTPVAVALGTNMTAVSISAGDIHSCALLNDGSVKCWGGNNFGQIGDGTVTSRSAPVAVDLGTNLTAVSIGAGGSHSCAVLNDGSVKCWGRNTDGQVGDGTSGTNRLSPVAVALGTNLTAVSISAGSLHSCAVLNDGSVKCWGRNSDGQVGDGTGTDRLSPVAVDLGTNLTAVSVSVAYSHSCALLNNGSVKCWGWNDDGQLGDGTKYTDRLSPVAVDLGTNFTAVSISTGSNHSCALLSDGSVKCWGQNTWAQIGDGTSGTDRLSPVAVDLGLNLTAVSISSGQIHSCAVLNDGSVKCWGSNWTGQIGDGTSGTDRLSPVAVDLGANLTAVSISGGGVHSCAVLNDGSVKCWGRNSDGQIGDGTSGTSRLSPVAVDLGTNLTAASISGGEYHSCAVLNDGSVKCWGRNSDGQIGDGTTGTDRLSPVAVDLGTNLTAVSISGGDDHSCAVLNDGSVKCWGRNDYGQVGDGTTGTDRLTPTVTNVVPQAPDAPTSVTGVSGNASVTVSWTAPSSDGGSAITSFDVQTYQSDGTTAVAGKTCTTSGTSCVVSGLVNGTVYKFKATATNSAGTSAESAASTATTPATVPGAPTSVTGASGDASVSVSWTAPSSDGGSAVTGYDVQAYESDGTTAVAGKTCTTAGTSCVVSGLTNGTPYTFTVVAVNSAGTGLASTASTAVTPVTGFGTAGAPGSVSVVAGDTDVIVAWTAPSSDGGAAISDYVVQYRPDGGSWTSFSDGVSAATSVPVTGLTNAMSYTFRVSAINSVGTGPASAASTAVVPTGVPDVDCSTAQSHPFGDVPASSYAYNDVGCIRSLGVTTGTSATTYSPGDRVTREQMAAFIARFYRAVTGNACGGSHPFSDVPTSSYAYNDVACIYSLGVTTGTSATTYTPGGYVTREQMAAFIARLYRTVTTKSCSGSHPFGDVPTSSYAYNDVGCIYTCEVTSGTSATTYSPGDYVTREQMAAFLARLFNTITT